MSILLILLGLAVFSVCLSQGAMKWSTVIVAFPCHARLLYECFNRRT